MPDWEGSAGQDVKGNRIHISLDQGKGNIVGVCLFVCFLGKTKFLLVRHFERNLS